MVNVIGGVRRRIDAAALCLVRAAVGRGGAELGARDLSGVELDYFFADGRYFRMHPGALAFSLDRLFATERGLLLRRAVR